MPFHAEQHLFAAKLVRKNGAWRTGAEREFFIKKVEQLCRVFASLGERQGWHLLGQI
jgi:hypothetical protein